MLKGQHFSKINTCWVGFGSQNLSLRREKSLTIALATDNILISVNNNNCECTAVVLESKNSENHRFKIFGACKTFLSTREW